MSVNLYTDMGLDKFALDKTTYIIKDYELEAYYKGCADAVAEYKGMIPYGYWRSCPCRYFKLSANVDGQFCKYLVI
jgi:hypothetical protein